MKIAIIGGGAAGLMAAATLQSDRPETEVFLIDRNDRLGKKVMISGGGRCNVTTGTRDIRELLKNYPRGGRFLSSAMYGFPPAAVYDWFESNGVPLKTQDDNRVFPQSDDGGDIVGVFEKKFRDSNVQVWLKYCVDEIARDENEKFHISFRNSREKLIVDRVILSTGGQAYRQTGSTGDGYGFAVSLGHTLTPLAPSLSSLVTEERWPSELAGVSIGCATISTGRGQPLSYTGPFIFTHKGISGPAAFAVSALIAFEKLGRMNPLPLSVDLFPNEKAEKMSRRLDQAIEENPGRSFLNTLATMVPKSLARTCILQTTGNQDKKSAEISRKSRLETIVWLKAVPLNVIERGAGDEFVTAGGIPTTEINPSTMESKICPGLYFAGEIMNVDGFTGGFNLQASWATGRLAGTNAGRK